MVSLFDPGETRYIQGILPVTWGRGGEASVSHILPMPETEARNETKPTTPRLRRGGEGYCLTRDSKLRPLDQESVSTTPPLHLLCRSKSMKSFRGSRKGRGCQRKGGGGRGRVAHREQGAAYVWWCPAKDMHPHLSPQPPLTRVILP